MDSINNRNQMHIEDNPEFFGGEMQPYVDSLTKNYEQKRSATNSAMITEKTSRKINKVSIWRKFAAFFSFL
jgi:hypothetical protein